MARKAAADPNRVNQNGQAMGAKGLQTRKRLVDATSDLLKVTPLRELTVSQIAREAKTSASTFYLYFNDVPEAVLGAIRGVSQSTPELLEMLDQPWPRNELSQRAEQFVHSYVQTWKSNAHLFRVRNLTADEGDGRFETARRLSVGPLLEALGRRINLSGSVANELDGQARAAALIAMIERLSSIPPHMVGNATMTYNHVINAAAYFMTCALTPSQDESERS